MRDPKRLKPLYKELARIHADKFPDWRLGQLLFNFLSWLGRDPFYLEDDSILAFAKAFAEGREASEVEQEIKDTGKANEAVAKFMDAIDPDKKGNNN